MIEKALSPIEQYLSIQSPFLGIDGSNGGGGGSILRLSAAFSILNKTPIHLFNIRKNKEKPGLRKQHIISLKTLAKLTQGGLSKIQVGTNELFFKPKTNIRERSLDIYIRGSSSIALILQAILLACVRNINKLSLNIIGGGSFVSWSPSLTYLRNITFEILRKIGYKIDINIYKEGFYPDGRANVLVTINPVKKLSPIQLSNRGIVKDIKIICVASSDLRWSSIAERITSATNNYIKKELGIDCFIRATYVETSSIGAGICFILSTDKGVLLGVDDVWKKGTAPETLGKNNAEKLIGIYQSGATCDPYLSDQLLPYMVLAEGQSEIVTTKLTQHAATNIALLKKFTPRKIEVRQHKLTKIICHEKEVDNNN